MTHTYFNANGDKFEKMDFLENRTILKKRKIPKPLVNANEDFTSVDEILKKFNSLRSRLIDKQKQLSELDIIKWHKITGWLHPPNKF